MSELFKLSKILKENASLYNLVAKSYPDETYMFTTLNNLSKLNESYTNNTKKLYRAISEAESKFDENNAFCEYFEQYKNTIIDQVNKINNMLSRFTITVDNFIDSNKELLEDDRITNCNPNVKISIHKFDHLDDCKIPKLCAKELYQKDFDFIGSMMQDLGPIASNEAKLQIIATVYNNLNKDIKHKWLKKCIETMTDDECDNIDNFAKKLYSEFRDEDAEEKLADKGTIYSAKEALDNYERYKDCINNTVSCVTKELSDIAEHIGSICIRNKDNTIKIQTNTDGVANRTYSVDTYGMNQFNMFMKAKISQINQICNLYSIALSIKMDAIIEFLNECKTVLQTVVNSCECCQPKTEEEPKEAPSAGNAVDSDEKDEEPDEEPEEDKDSEGEPSDDDNEIGDDDTPSPEDFDYPEDKEEDSVSDDDVNQDIPEEDKDKEVVMGSKEESVISNIDNNIDTFKESYFFAYNIYALESAMLTQDLKEYISEQVLTEADQDELKKLSDDTKIWESFLVKLKELWRKFNETVIQNSEPRIKQIDVNKQVFLQCEIEGKDKDGNDSAYRMYEYNTEPLNEKIPSFNWESMKDQFNNEEEFIDKFLTKYKPGEGESFIDKFGKAIIPTGKIDNDAPKIDKGKLVSFCVSDYKTYINTINNDIKLLDSAKSPAMRTYKESVTFDSYFTEADDTTEPENKPGSGTNTSEPNKASEPDKNSGANNKAKLRIYFKICSQMCSKKMTAVHNIFNTYYGQFVKIMKYNDKPIDSSKNKKEENK